MLKYLYFHERLHCRNCELTNNISGYMRMMQVCFNVGNFMNRIKSLVVNVS